MNPDIDEYEDDFLPSLRTTPNRLFEEDDFEEAPDAEFFYEDEGPQRGDD